MKQFFDIGKSINTENVAFFRFKLTKKRHWLAWLTQWARFYELKRMENIIRKSIIIAIIIYRDGNVGENVFFIHFLRCFGLTAKNRTRTGTKFIFSQIFHFWSTFLAHPTSIRPNSNTFFGAAIHSIRILGILPIINTTGSVCHQLDSRFIWFWFSGRTFFLFFLFFSC